MPKELNSITRLLIELRETVKRDWAAQRRAGQRKNAPSLSDMQAHMHQLYPDVFKSNFWKQVYNADRNSVNGPFGVGHLEQLLEYLYLENNVAMGWPQTTETIQGFGDGEFAELILPYVDGTASLLRSYSDKEYIELIQVALRVKENYASMKKDLVSEKRRRQQYEEALKIANEREQTLMERIARIEGLLVGRNEPALKEELSQLKQIIRN